MHALAVLSMKNRALIALVTIVAAVFGGLALTGLKQELLPSVQLPQLAILTTYPGAAPEVVNDDVSTPIETAIQGVAGIESTSATSSTNLSFVSATFTYGTNLATAEQKINQAINRIASQLPEDLDPQVLAGSLDDFPVIQIAVTDGEDGDTDALAELLKRTAVPDIQDVDGVREAALIGDVGQRVTITPNPEQLLANGLSTQSIGDALQQNGLLLPAGELTEGDSTFAVQAGSRLGSVDDIAALPIVPQTPAPGASIVTIGEIATVELTDNPVTSISRVDGEPALTIAVTKLPAANTVEVSNAVRDLMPELEKTLGSGVTLTIVFDQAPYIEQSIESLATEGLLGLAFAVLIILIFLLDVRATIVTAISIPTSVLITFIGLQASGYTLNILTLGALTIAIGRVVDDSIVVIENIKRHMAASRDRSADGRAFSIVTAVREVAGAITASTITTVVVFLPLAFVGDMTGELFRPFALTVTIALLASLFVALTIVPVLAYWFLRAKERAAGVDGAASEPVVSKRAAKKLAAAEQARREAEAASDGEAALAETALAAEASRLPEGVAPSPAIVDPQYLVAPAPAEATPPVLDVAGEEPAASATLLAETPADAAPQASTRRARKGGLEDEAELEHVGALQRGYLPIINWTLRHSLVTIIIAVLVLIGTGFAVPLMKTNLFGDSGQNTLTVSQTLPVGASLDAQDAAATRVEDVLRDIDGIETVQLSIGSSGSSFRDAFTGGGSGSITYSITTDESADQEALQAEVRSQLADISGAGDIQLAASSGLGGSSDITINVTAPDQSTLDEATATLTDKAENLDGMRQVTNNLAESRPYIAVEVDRAKAAEAGYSEVALGGFVSQAMQPQTVGTVVIDETTLSISVATENPPVTREELAALEVPTLLGPVPLDELATVEQVDGPATITTVKGQRSATVSITPSSDNLGSAGDQLDAMLTDVELPPGASATIGGVAEQQRDSFMQLGLAMLAAILIVYIVMVATFRSLRQPLLLLVSVPFAATGAIGLQLATGIPLGIPSLIGVLMLIGIVVTNAIVLVDLVNQYRRRGMSVEDSVRHGASRRLRPILMTALATIFALIPMALGITGHGGFISQPLAIVVIGGLISSTLLTLVVLPTLYNLVEGAKERRMARRAVKEAAAVVENEPEKVAAS